MRLLEYWKVSWNTAKLYREAWREIFWEYPVEVFVTLMFAIGLAFGVLIGADFLGRKIRKWRR